MRASRIKTVFTFVVLSGASLLLCTPAHSQASYAAQIRGTVTDQSGAVVPKADVKAINPQTGETRNVTTDAAGRYTIGNVLPGVYEIHVTATGFSEVTTTGVTATINTVTRVDVQMRLGSQTQQVTVSGAATALQTDKSDTHTELSPHELANLPLPNYRNFQSLFNLVPGATPAVFTNSITDTPQRSLSTNVNGTNRNNNNTRVDGAADVFVWLPHATLYVPPEETIETVNVTTSSFDAEQGMAGGAAVTITTKSGTNDFHGVAFAYWDNSMLEARNFFYYGRASLSACTISMAEPWADLSSRTSSSSSEVGRARGNGQTIPRWLRFPRPHSAWETSAAMERPSMIHSPGTQPERAGR